MTHFRIVVAATLFLLVMPALFSAEAMAQVLATVHNGDVVSITATLNTTDPNENGEGEPLIISGPGCLIIVNAYAFTQTVSCTATADGTISASINGADGDESSTLSVIINPAPLPITKDPAYVAEMRNLRDFYGGLAIFYSVLAASPPCIAAEPCPFWAASIAGANGALSIGFNRKAEDPIDSNFIIIDQPIILTFPPFVAGLMLTQAEAAAINNLLANQEQIVAYINASITAFNRAQGAAAAGNSFWQQQQLRAFHLYDFKLRQLITSQITLLTNLQAALQAAGFTPVAITPVLALQAEQDILTNNGRLVHDLKQALVNFGADSTTIVLAMKVLSVQDINKATGSIPGSIVTPALINTLLSNTTALLLSAPKMKDDCKHDGWQGFAKADGSLFKNQGDCVSYVETGK